MAKRKNKKPLKIKAPPKKYTWPDFEIMASRIGELVTLLGGAEKRVVELTEENRKLRKKLRKKRG